MSSARPEHLPRVPMLESRVRHELAARLLTALAVVAIAALAVWPQSMSASPPPAGAAQSVAAPLVEPLAGDDIQQTYNDVAVRDFYFDPADISIPVGGIVRWTNRGANVHSTTSDTGLWSWTLLPGYSYSVRFLAQGTYAYHCQFHPTMQGTIVVGPAQPPVTPGPSPTAGGPPLTGPGTIVYDAPTSGTITDLFTIQSDGTQKQQLTKTPGLTEAQPRWSPDRTQVAYAAGQGPAPFYAWRILVLDLASGQSRAITNGPENYEPTWSPDGAWLAYTEILRRNGSVIGTTISKIRADGTGSRRLVYLAGSSAGIGSPDWSPDGSRIAFVVRSDAAGGEIYVVDAGGTQTGVLLSRPGWDDIDPQWSPDGRYVAFASAQARGALQDIQHDLWLADLTTGTAGTIARAPDWNLRRPSWSPDGSQLVFNGKFSTHPYGLYVVPAMGGTVAGPLDVGYEPDWGSASLVPVITPTPPPGTPTIPPFPTFPPPGPTATEGSPPTFPPPTTLPTNTEVPTATVTPTDTEEPTEEPTETPVAAFTNFLPWVANGFALGIATATPLPPACLTDEVEPNNTRTEADAQNVLCDDRAVRGTLPASDVQDLFRIEVRYTGKLGGDLLLIGAPAGTDYDLLLYSSASSTPVAESRNAAGEAEHFDADVTPGRYYAAVVPASGSARSDAMYRIVVYRE